MALKRTSQMRKPFYALFVFLLIITAGFMVLISDVYAETPTPTPTIEPSPTVTPTPTQQIMPTPTRRPTPTPTRRGTPTPENKVTTVAATNITDTSATFNSYATSSYELLSVYYEYWVSADPSTKKTTPSKGYFWSAHDSTNVGGLIPDTPYTYRAVMNGLYGNQVSFSTLPSPGTTPKPTPTPLPGSYLVSYVIQGDGGNSATISVTITNKSIAAVNGWTLIWIFPDKKQTIINLWGATYTQQKATVTVKDGGLSPYIPANGGTISFGFTLNYSKINPKPTSFTLNGVACLVQ